MTCWLCRYRHKVHLIRAAMRFVTYEHRKKVAAALRPIYTAPTVEAAESELLAFADSPLGRKYPATVATWENAWERFIPFLAFPPELRRIIYTTNAVVIWSRSSGVRDVVDEQVRRRTGLRARAAGAGAGDDPVLGHSWRRGRATSVS